jgi:hypothetical protein
MSRDKQPSGAPGSRALPRLPAMVAALLLLLACGAEPAPTAPHGFAIDYSTGSIPPPFNHSYVIDVEFDEDGARVNYLLEYHFREQLTEDELRAEGYTADDDIIWSGFVEQDVAVAWSVLARETVLQEPEAQPPPGADRLEVRIVQAEGQIRSGVPEDREPWLEIAREVDSRARGELATEREEP